MNTNYNQTRYRKLYQHNRMEGSGMKLQKIVILLLGLCFFFACSPGDVQDTQEARVADVKVPVLTVLNPLGTPPPIKLLPMAPRLDTLEGKTIYVDNNGYPGTSVLLPELIAVLKGKYPTTKFIYNDKPAGRMTAEDPAAGEADAIIIATGH
jgi:hypothetical protein